MSLLAKLNAAVETKETGEIIPRLSTYWGVEAAHPERSGDLPQAYRVHSWAHACIRVIAQSIASVPIKAASTRARGGPVSRKRATGEPWADAFAEWKAQEGVQIVESHPLLDLLNSPMPEAGITRVDMIQAVMTYLETAGNAYVEKIYQSEAKREVSRLWPRIDPRHMYVVPGKERLIDGYVWRGSGKGVVYDEDDIIHFAYLHPENPYYGLSPIAVLKQALIADIRATDWNRWFFERNAEPGLVLQTDQRLSEREITEMQNRWDNRYRGMRQAHRTAVLSGGTHIERAGLGQKDMDFLNLRKWTLREVSGVLGVPLILLNDRESLNRATAQTELRMFWENTCIPKLVQVEETLNQGLHTDEQGVRLFFDLSGVEALRGDQERKARIWRLRSAQGVTVDEMREAWGLDPIGGEEGGTVYMPSNMVPVGTLKQTGAKAKAVTKDAAAGVETLLAPEKSGTQRAVHEAHLPGIGEAGVARGVDVLEHMGHEVPPGWDEGINWQEEIRRWLDEPVTWEDGVVEPRLAHKIKEIDGVTHDRAARIVRQGVEEGKTTAQIAKDLRGEFKEMSKTRSLTIARTEGGAAISHGQHETYTAIGIELHAWHCQFFNSRVEHEQAHRDYSQGIPIDTPFTLSDGTTTTAPRLSGVAKHDINCYCEEIPMMPGEKSMKGMKAFEDWMGDLEKQATVRAYIDALAAWIRSEGDRYARHLEEMSGAPA